MKTPILVDLLCSNRVVNNIPIKLEHTKCPFHILGHPEPPPSLLSGERWNDDPKIVIV